jgi:L-gulonate 3-dehydrogenase
MERVGIVGAGLIGRSWAIVFARAGHEVRIWDRDTTALSGAVPLVREALDALRAYSLISEEPEQISRRIQSVATLEDAVTHADYVQESVDERVETKRSVFQLMDAAAGNHCILASSTSTIPASTLSEQLTGRRRCIVAHPVNPPHLVPVVEVSPSPWTDAEIVTRTQKLHENAGQIPVLVRREVSGFIINRLQAALLMEAWRLVKDGVCSAEDLDKCVRDGLGLRWSFMGPFETIDLNAPGGVADYARRYGPAMHEALSGIRDQTWDDALVAAVEKERRTLLPASQLPERAAWRDRRLMALVAHRRAIT